MSKANKAKLTAGVEANDSAVQRDLEQRGTYKMRLSPELEQALAEASRVVTQESSRRQLELRVSSFEWNPRLVALAIAFLIIVGTILWVGCRFVEGMPALLAN